MTGQELYESNRNYAARVRGTPAALAATGLQLLAGGGGPWETLSEDDKMFWDNQAAVRTKETP